MVFDPISLMVFDPISLPGMKRHRWLRAALGFKNPPI